MNDKPAPPQIVDLFEAMKGSLYDMSRSPDERSVGDVPAPKRELLHDALGISPEHARAAAAAHGGGEPAPGADELCPYCGAHWPDRHADERAAVVKYLRAGAVLAKTRAVQVTFEIMAESIEKGEHAK